MILVDTNAWIDHLRKQNLQLVQYLVEGRVRTCDVVIGELLLGTGLPRDFITDLSQLPRLPSPSAPETTSYVQLFARSFSGSGVGWADAQILLTASKAGARIYTADRAVKRLCKKLRVSMP